MWKTSAAAIAAQLFTQFQHPSSSNSSDKINFLHPNRHLWRQVATKAARISSAKENAMQPPILKTYRPEMPLGENVFFIQSKRLHSGRVLKNPIPNCFAALCCSKEHSDFWTSICTALYLGKKYQILILGSVVPFIRLRETAELLATMKHLDTNQVQAKAKQLNLIDEALKSSIERTKLIQQLQSATAQALNSLL